MDPARRAFFEKTIVDDDAVRELAARHHKLQADQRVVGAQIDARPDDSRSRGGSRISGHVTLGDFSDEVKKARPKTPLLIIAGEWDQPDFLARDLETTS